MKEFVLLKIVFLFFPLFLLAQDFTFESDTLTIHGAAGELLILNADIKNISQQELHIRIIRVQNILPPGWTTSLCSGQLCYPPDVDMYTIPDSLSGIPPLGAGETAKFHLNFNTNETPGTASVPIRVEKINDVNEFIELTFTASTLPTGLSESDLPLTGTFRLHSNYPNPFNPHTSIPFEIGDRRAVNVQLSVYNILGQKVAILLNEQLLPGKYEVTWNARDQSGDMVPSGLYFYKMQAGAFREVGNMILVK